MPDTIPCSRLAERGAERSGTIRDVPSTQNPRRNLSPVTTRDIRVRIQVSITGAPEPLSLSAPTRAAHARALG